MVFVEGRRRGAEHGFGVRHVLLESGALDGAVEGPGDEASPEEHAHGHESEDSADDDEDGAFWEGRGLHVGRVLGWGDGGGDDGIGAGEFGEARGKSSSICRGCISGDGGHRRSSACVG